MVKILCAAVMAVASLVFAAPAAADPVEEFLIDVEQSGFGAVDERDMLALGLSICVDLLSGVTAQEEIQQATLIGVDPDVAADLIGLSVGHLCPSAIPAAYGAA